VERLGDLLDHRLPGPGTDEPRIEWPDE
jgi:hypothetical protein